MIEHGLGSLPILEELSGSQNILLAGCGGGFDVFCALPLYFHLRQVGKKLVLGNLTFSDLSYVNAPQLTEVVKEVDAFSEGSANYFPEKYLAEWLAGQNCEQSIYCFEKTGVTPLHQAYQAIVDKHRIDTVVLIDGGTDSLMRGDEANLGTPHEDMLSIAAVDRLATTRNFLLCLGFGIDAFHGVSHAHFLEGVAELDRAGAYLGAFSLLSTMPEVRKYIEAVDYANRQMPCRASIVNSSVVSALEGQYGDVHRTGRTQGSTLWINPLMALYWCFRLNGVAERLQYLDWIRETDSFAEVVLRIEGYHRQVKSIRPRHPIPV